MNNVLYNPFFNATRDVFELMLALNDISDKPYAVNDGVHGQMDIVIAIGITGDLEGKVVYHFPKETSLKMVNIMSGMEFEEIDEFVTSAMGEIANIISGNVLSNLSEQELTCDILPPEILATETLAEQIKNYNFKSGMQITTDIGEVNLEIMFNKAN